MIAFEKIIVSSSEKTLVDISFEVHSSLAIVGESGSGKSLTMKAIMGILPKELDFAVQISGIEKLKRGENLAFVPQNPFTALSPMSKIKKQFWGVDKLRAIELLEQMGLSAEILDRFPSELSGGQLQRVIIAIALGQNPKLLLMDEPTTALDADTKSEIVSLVKSLMEKFGFYLIFVTHELSLARELCEYIMVIKDGKQVEFGKAEAIFLTPKNDYTKRLMAADFKDREFRK